MISNSVDEGSFGNIFDCIDLQKNKEILVIKISDDY